jgi:hypothetical protein
MILADYLAASGVTVTDFAGRIGRKVTTVHAWVSGAREPDLRAVEAIDVATAGAVTARDWVSNQRTMREAKAALRAPASDAAA